MTRQTISIFSLLITCSNILQDENISYLNLTYTSPTLQIVGQGPTALAAGAGEGSLDI